MKKTKHIIAGNWKMNPDNLEEARAIFSGIKRAAEKTQNTHVVICPPFMFLSLLAKNQTPKLTVGAQDIFHEVSGPYTGEISPVMVKNSGATHVIIGHSERRVLGDTNEVVNKKILAAVREDLNVIFCVGEEKRDSEGSYLEFIKQEIIQGLAKVQKKFLFNLTIAYEPIWEIGKNDRNVMAGKDIHEMAIYLKKILGDLYDPVSAEKVPILYGGSASSFNAEDIVKDGHVNGLLVGRQSLRPEEFGEILRIVDAIKSPAA